MRERIAELDVRSTQVIGVAPHADYQAQQLIDDGMPFPLLLDPENELRSLLGADQRFSWHGVVAPRAALAYWRAARQARHFDPIWSQATERPVVALIDGAGEVAWSHVGRRIGDYPSVDEILAAVDDHL